MTNHGSLPEIREDAALSDIDRFVLYKLFSSRTLSKKLRRNIRHPCLHLMAARMVCSGQTKTKSTVARIACGFINTSRMPANIQLKYANLLSPGLGATPEQPSLPANRLSVNIKRSRARSFDSTRPEAEHLPSPGSLRLLWYHIKHPIATHIYTQSHCAPISPVTHDSRLAPTVLELLGRLGRSDMGVVHLMPC